MRLSPAAARLGLLVLALAVPAELVAGLGSGAAKGLGRALGKGAARSATPLATKAATKSAGKAAAGLATKSTAKVAGGATTKGAGKAVAKPVATGTRSGATATTHGGGPVLGQGDGAFDPDALRAGLASRGLSPIQADRIVRRQGANAVRRDAARVTAAGTGGKLTARSVRSSREWARATNPHGGSNQIPAPDELVGFPGLVRARPKTSVQGGGGMRKRWKNQKGEIFEWDSQHGAVERYTAGGQHLGEFDAWTGAMTKGPKPGRTVEP